MSKNPPLLPEDEDVTAMTPRRARGGAGAKSASEGDSIDAMMHAMTAGRFHEWEMAEIARREREAVIDAREVRESKLEGLFVDIFGKDGTFSSLEFDESKPIKAQMERLATMIALLDILDPALIDNDFQANVAIMKGEREVIERDKILSKLIEVIAGPTMTEEEKADVYTAFYYIIHQVAYDKPYLQEGRATNVSKLLRISDPQVITNHFAIRVSDEQSKLMEKATDLDVTKEYLEDRRILKNGRLPIERVVEIANHADGLKGSWLHSVDKYLRKELLPAPGAAVTLPRAATIGHNPFRTDEGRT